MALKRTFQSPYILNPPIRAGQYFFPVSENSSATSTLGTGTLRVTPWILERTMTVARIGGEVTTVGDAGSRFRLGIYADDGTGYPGSLVLDAGVINGDSATVQEITINQTLAAGIYWIGGATQIVTTTQPTMRCINGWFPRIILSNPTLPSGAAVYVAYSQSGVTGALPATFSSTVAPLSTSSRPFFRAT